MTPPLRYPRLPLLAGLGPGHHVVESSAGTGKTYLLEHLFVDLVLSHAVPADQILVVTFTEKATAELVLRLRRLLGDLARLQPDDPQAVAAAQAPAAAAWVIDESARRILGDALLAFDRIDILTIHAFCQRVLREHAFVQGRLFDEELVGTEAAFAEAFADVLRTHVAQDEGLAKVLAAWLGSGETVAGLRQLLADCDHTKAQCLRPEFDEARLDAALAAWPPLADQGDQIRAALKAAKVNGNTINGVLRHLDALSRIVAGCEGNPWRFLVDGRAAKQADIGHVLDRLPSENGAGIIATLGSRLRALAAATVPLAAVAAQRFLPVVQARAARGKRSAGRFDFEDMLRLVDQALAYPGPAGHALAASLRRRYRHALIDEFQDTDEIQWAIFRRIFVDAADRHALTVIGDPKQAIYGFRGANVFTYLDARRALQPGAKPSLVLERNFRSTAGLIDATNLIFEQRAGFFRPGSGITYDHPVRCGRPHRRLVGPAGKPAAPVVVFGIETAEDKLKADEARAAVLRAIVRELGEILEHGDRLSLRDDGPPRAVRARDVFVLTFTNAESQAVGRALAQAHIPYAFYKQGELFATAEAREILDVLRAVCAPEDRALRARALLTRFFDLDLAEVATATALGAAAGPTRLLLRLAEQARAGDVPALFAALIEETGVLRRELFAVQGERGLTNLTHVFELLQADWASRHASLPELVERLAAFCRGSGAPPGRDSDLQRLETDRSAVQILTVFRAKGLEAEVVFLCGGTGEKPGRDVRVIHERSTRAAWVGPLEDETKAHFAQEQHDERCRLLYVALTRARYRLYLPHYPPAKMKLTGPYGRLNQRLDEIFAAPPVSGLERRRVVADRVAPEDAGQSLRAPAPADNVTADVVAGQGTPTVPADVAEIRQRRKGFLVTSYTAVKRARRGLHPVEEADLGLSPGEDHAAEMLPAQLPTDALPGGAETGIFLHDILAEVPLDELAARPDLATWLARPRVLRLLERLRRRHGRTVEEILPAARLVHAAYTTPVRLGGTAISGLATATEPLREMEFLFPIPENGHPLLSRPALPSGERPWRIERGVVKGFIDLFFAHAGHVYVCDWKSDLLPSYAEADLLHHCRQHYDVQARLYTLAALRLCDIGDAETYARRFGAVLFCFLRGRAPGDERRGIFAFTPSWQDILAWETEMLADPFWGLGR